MRLKYFFILSFFNFLITLPAIAQEDDDSGVAAQSLIRKKVAKLPSYPTMEVQGVCIDAATKQPLAGIMVQALGDGNYTAMTDDDGTFTIKVPTFTSALYVHAPEFLSLQVGLGKKGDLVRVEMISDKPFSYFPWLCF